jgi:aminopeptidase
MDSATIDRLADLAVTFGANVQPGQMVSVRSELGKEDLTRAVAARAYKAGAVFVDVAYADPYLQRSRIEHAVDQALGYEPAWTVARLQEMGEKRAATIALAGAVAPGVLAGLDAERIGRDRPPGIKESMRNLAERTLNWTIVPCPTPGWAAQVYPDLSPESALERLWEQVVHICRLDHADPVEAWEERMSALERIKPVLTEQRFAALHFEGPGTDLTVGLFPTSTWLGGSLTTADGLVHHPNLPTEEVFTTPDPARVDGVVRSTKPLELSGTIVRDLAVRFEGGRAVQIDASAGADVMRAWCHRDEGAARLGEVALVDRHGRVGPLDTVFYDTLIDENAASHLAFGMGFAWAVGDGDADRVNVSEVHEDFMIGGDQVLVTGIAADGSRRPVLRHGEWQL